MKSIFGFVLLFGSSFTNAGTFEKDLAFFNLHKSDSCAALSEVGIYESKDTKQIKTIVYILPTNHDLTKFRIWYKFFNRKIQGGDLAGRNLNNNCTRFGGGICTDLLPQVAVTNIAHFANLYKLEIENWIDNGHVTNYPGYARYTGLNILMKKTDCLDE